MAIALVAILALIPPAVAVGVDRPLVVTSIRPLAVLTRDLAGDGVSIHELIAAGQDPHHIALQPSQRRVLDQADLIVWVGPGLETSLARPLAGFLQGTLVTWLPEPEGSHAAHHHGHHHGHHHDDPHPWLDPLQALEFARELAAVLGERFPHLADDIGKRLAAMEQSVALSLKDIDRRLAPHRHVAFVAEHAGYGPFVNQFGLRQAGSLSDSAGIAQGPRNLWSLQQHASVACVAVEQAPGSRLAAQLAADLAVPVVEIDPFGAALPADAGYLDLLESIAGDFERCLSSAGGG